MKSLWAIFKVRFRLLLQYRAAALAGLGTQAFFGLVYVAGFTAFYRSSGRPPPLPLAELIGYAWLNQAFFALLPWRVDPDIKTKMHSGDIAYELLRPLDLYWFWFARAVALKTAPTVLRAVPMLIVAGFFLGLPPPASAESAALWIAGVLGAVALAASFTVLLNVSLFWTLSADGAQFLLPTIVALLSGQLLPLPLFPDFLQPWLAALPFRGLLDTPNRLYLGELTGSAAWMALLHQAIWIATLMAAGRWLLQRGLRRTVVQGG